MNIETIKMFDDVDKFQKEVCTYLENNIEKNENETRENSEIIIAYLHKINEIYNSSFKLLKLNEVYSANCLYRVIINLGLKVIELIRNKSFLNELKEYEEKETVRLINSAIKSKLIDNKNLDSYSVNLIRKYNSNTKKVKNIADSELAKNNGLEDFYTMYRLQCECIHGSFSKIYEEIYIKDKGMTSSKFSDIDWSLKLLITYIIKIYEKVIEYIDSEFNENCFDQKMDEIINLANKLK